MTRIATLGASAQDYVDSANTGALKSKIVVSTASAAAADPYNEDSTVWQKIWGIGQGILNMAPTPGSVTRPEQKIPPVRVANAGMGVGILAAAFIGYMLVSKKRRSPKSRYARMIRSRK